MLDDKDYPLSDFFLLAAHKLCNISITTRKFLSKALTLRRLPVWIKSQWFFWRTSVQSYLQSCQNCLTAVWSRDASQFFGRCQLRALNNTGERSSPLQYRVSLVSSANTTNLESRFLNKSKWTNSWSITSMDFALLNPLLMSHHYSHN